MISLKQLRRSFKHAIRGIVLVFRQEQSFRIQSIVGLVVLASALVLEVRGNQLIVLFLLVGVVLGLELINSIFERIVDTFKPRIHPAVRDIKDIMAGSVLVASVVSAIIGLLIFLPRIAALF
jgi:diacylglycerol kinase